MDPIRIEKFQAMKRYRKRKHFFLPSLIQCLAAALFLGLFLSCPPWLPRMCYYLKLFFLVWLPDMVTAMSGPRCLFIVCNIIVVFLVGEWKLSRTSPTTDIYEEYMNNKKMNAELQAEGRRSRKGSVMENTLVEEEEDLEGEEEVASSEIDKKAEDFIARVNWQRRLEARRLLSCG